MIDFPKFKYSKPLFWLLIGILIALLLSCSPVKRLNRLHKNHPYLFEAKMDTILHRDTIEVVVPGMRMDTAVHISKLEKAVSIKKNGVTTTLWKNGDTLSVETTAEPKKLNVPYEAKIPYTKYEVEETPFAFPDLFIKIALFILLIIFIALLLYIAKKLKWI